MAEQTAWPLMHQKAPHSSYLKALCLNRGYSYTLASLVNRAAAIPGSLSEGPAQQTAPFHTKMASKRSATCPAATHVAELFFPFSHHDELLLPRAEPHWVKQGSEISSSRHRHEIPHAKGRRVCFTGTQPLSTAVNLNVFTLLPTMCIRGKTMQCVI